MRAREYGIIENKDRVVQPPFSVGKNATKGLFTTYMDLQGIKPSRAHILDVINRLYVVLGNP
jgi:hypothetical protein